MVTDDIEKDIEESLRIRRESLEEKPISKILNKKRMGNFSHAFFIAIFRFVCLLLKALI